MTRYEAHIGKDWKELGIANVVVARIRPDKGTDFAVFLVDLLCLGVKDAMGDEGLTDSEFQSFLQSRIAQEIREPIHPACAKKLIEGAIAYAENLGFSPHRDYRKARKVLSGLDASSCPETFVYGEDGMPCYVRGPNDSEERVDRVLAILERKCGVDGFKFVDPSEEEDMDDDSDYTAKEDLIDWLEEEPDNVPRFYEVSGIITAMQLCPGFLTPTLLLNVLWNPAPTFTDNDEAQEFLDLLQAYWNDVVRLISATVAVDADPAVTCIDIEEEDFAEDQPMEMMLAMRQWARGFMRATEIWPKAWGTALVRPDLQPHWEVLDCFAKIEEPGNLARMDNMTAENPPRTVARAVAIIARTLRDPFTIPGE